MVFSSTTFLFLFLPAVIFFYWLPNVFIKIKQLFGIREKSEVCEREENNREKGLEKRDKGFVLANDASIPFNITKQSLESNNTLNEINIDKNSSINPSNNKILDCHATDCVAISPLSQQADSSPQVESLGNTHHQSLTTNHAEASASANNPLISNLSSLTSENTYPPKLLSQRFRTYKNLVLLFFSILFYAWGEPAFVLVMILSIIANYAFGRLIDKYRNKDKLLLWLSVAFNLGILFIFKYLCFTLQNICWLINKDFSSIKIALPIGISFFTFQAMSYVIDVYEKKVEVQKNLFNIGLYISLFPQLIAGPIVRYDTIAKEIENRNENYDDFAEGIVKFIQGLAKKVIIANEVAVVADAAFGMRVNELSTEFAWLGAIAYTLQIYFDFSGYSDMAIGLGRMFGFHFLENFNYPYMASSITDFWRRWHISLSSWFRDYVYFPLGGSRVDSKSRHIFNLFVVWLLTGIWHGANWTFIAWGLFYFVLLVIEKHSGLDNKKAWWGHIYTMFFVILAWVLFRATNITFACEYMKVMFVSNGASPDVFWLYWNNYRLYLILGIILSFKRSLHRCSPSFAWAAATDGGVQANDRMSSSRRAGSQRLTEGVFKEETNNNNQKPLSSLRATSPNSFAFGADLQKKQLDKSCLAIEILANIAYIFLFLLSVSFIVKSDYNPFIYFNF